MIYNFKMSFFVLEVIAIDMAVVSMSVVDRYVHFSGPLDKGLRNSLQIAIRICQFSQYLGTKVDMLFEIAKSVETVIILGKTAISP